MFEKPKKLSEPNEMGFQFGINESLTEYAHQEQPKWGGTSMPSVGITVLEAWKDDKPKAYLLVDDETNQPIKEISGYEACAAAIDMYKLIKQDKENNKTK